MKWQVFTLCLFLILSQATPIDKLRQSTIRAQHVAAATPSTLVEKAAVVTNFEMEKSGSKNDITEAVAVENLASAEVAEAASTVETKTSQESAQTQQAQTTTTTTNNAKKELKTETKSDEKKADKPMEWEDAVLVEDLTKERANNVDANTKYIGANMKTSALGKKHEPTQGSSFLQFAPPYYYPIHPAFLQQAQRQQTKQEQGRSEEGARTQGWGDLGTPLYYARDFGSYDGMGAGGMNMYAPYGSPSPFDPSTSFGGGGGGDGVGGPPVGGAYYSPYGAYGSFAPPPPPPPSDLPLPPYIQIV